MKISEIAIKAHISIHTIRYYEKIGLITDTEVKRKANNYRDYTDDILEKLYLIKIGQQSGFSLKEMKEMFILLGQNNLNSEMRRSLLKNKLNEIDSKINELRAVRKILEKKIRK